MPGSDYETRIVGPDTLRGICRRAVAIWKETVGRGPETAHAFAGDHGIAMIFRSILTQYERAAMDRGDAEAVVSMRRQLFAANRERLIAAVESESGRRIGAVLYACSPEDDMSAFTFVLEPAGTEEADVPVEEVERPAV